jgi:hypothetical protein
MKTLNIDDIIKATIENLPHLEEKQVRYNLRINKFYGYPGCLDKGTVILWEIFGYLFEAKNFGTLGQTIEITEMN